tara:strand:+ start:316 stop:876 length:561 start_codon:yes stop_codon:yes gene_type:complete
MPKGLMNGDRLAKDIVENNIDIALNRKSVDLNNKPLFKDDNDFNKFMQKVAPEGMTYDPTEERTVAALGEGDTPTTAKGVYKRTKPVSKTLKSSPRPVARPTRPTADKTPIAIPVSGGRGNIIEKPGERQEAARKAAAARRKKKDKAKKVQKKNVDFTKKKLKEFKKTGKVTGFDKGGLMNKKGKK